jgi:hypothetical protein
VQKVAEQAEAGRKFVIYERTTGLFAHWYIAMRGEEECNRVARLRREINCAQTGLSSFPDDGATFEELYGVPRHRLGEAAEVAA